MQPALYSSTSFCYKQKISLVCSYISKDMKNDGNIIKENPSMRTCLFFKYGNLPCYTNAIIFKTKIQTPSPHPPPLIPSPEQYLIVRLKIKFKNHWVKANGASEECLTLGSALAVLNISVHSIYELVTGPLTSAKAAYGKFMYYLRLKL
jgi:hypothetical protein